MIRVARIPRIRSLGVLRNFDWPEDLPDFQRFNVIYGWNGSGKTLLSRILSGLQKGHPPTCEDIAVKLSSGDVLRNKAFEDAPSRMKIRVFNRDFVDESVYRAGSSIRPIYVFGEKAGDKQKDLEVVVAELTKKREAITSMEQKQRVAQQQLHKFCTDRAALVREALQITGRKFERPDFAREMDRLLEQGGYEGLVLEDDEKARVMQRMQAEPRRQLDIVDFSFASSERFFEEAKKLCDSSVAAAIIEDLRQRPDVNTWVGEGLNLHQKHKTETCLFCDQPLPAGRLQELEAHFSEEYRRLMDGIERLAEEVKTAMEAATRIGLHDPGLLYLDLYQRYTETQTCFDAVCKRYIHELEGLLGVLDNKRNNPFQKLGGTIPPWSINDEAIAAVNGMISEHNRKVDNHQGEVDKAKQRLKCHLVAERAPEYLNLKGELDNAGGALKGLHQEAADLDARRRELERDLVEDRRPAEELNRELASYLGHGELQFEVEETGYRIARDGQTAEALSEGEKTAIAFLYFLKSLEDRDFDIQNGIVVIDDPVSSLDSNALYYAFGFMKSRVKDAGQLFVLTHNFLFFRQVKNWFGNQKKEAAYYMLDVRRDNGSRNSRLALLDPLLKNYEAEYHYLFWLVYRAAHTEDPGRGLEQFYYLPNVVRRLLEAFLQFKVPDKKNLYDQLQELDFDPAKKERIRRFCETHSHSRVIDEPEQDPAILGEACSVAGDVSSLIRAADEGHFNRMVQLCKGKK